MTKTEIRKHITKTFCERVNLLFPKYSIGEGEGGRLQLVNTESDSWEDGIEYMRSGHWVCCFNGASDEVKRDVVIMNAICSDLKREYGV